MPLSSRLFRLGLLCTLILSLSLGCSKKGGVDIDDDGDGGGDDNDTTPPATVVDLRASFVGITTATICWTAPGDDGDSGYAHQYDLRASLDSIHDNNFFLAYKIDSIDLPYPAGVTQCYGLDSLTSGQKYYFALKTRDFEGNWSGLSNCINLTCLVDSVVSFPDTALERIVRQVIGKPTGDIMRSELQNIFDLPCDDQHITNLSGVQYCSQLTMLHASFNNIASLVPVQGMLSLRMLGVTGSHITDITPVAGLTNLEQLIMGQNPITDLTPISGLTNLKTLFVHSLQVTDFSPVGNLVHLEDLNISSNPAGNYGFIANLTSLKILVFSLCGLTDISMLQNLSSLEHLFLNYNEISDLTPLTGLVHLKELDLRNNNITDILPLVNNTGLGTGNVIYLQNNPLSDLSKNTHIPALQTRGVTVYW